MNIVLVSLDTQRADRLSCYGHNRPTSPSIDRLASEGALFAEMFSPHIPTLPGHTCMMTGRDLWSHQVSGQSHDPGIREGIPMLAEILARHGYYTAAADTIGDWFQRGFEVYEGYAWEQSLEHGSRKAEGVNQTVLRIIDGAAAQDRPFFLFLHYWDPHTPYLPPAPFSRMFYEGHEKDPANRSMDPVWAFENFKWYFHEWMPGVTDIEFPKAQYDAEIAYMDACFAHTIARLQAHGALDDTLLVITADHGEELDEHGCWFDHHGLYDTNLRIPLILRKPGLIPAGARVPGFARSFDIVPTILDYAGIDDPSLHFDGCTLRPMIEQPVGTSRGICEVLHCTENTWMKKRAFRTHAWKLIVALEPDIHDFPPVELYDLRTDPAEKRNLAAELPEVVAEMRARMDEHIARRVAESGLPDPLPLHPIPLHSVGRPPAVEEPGDEKLEAGDFVGYEREDA